MTWYQRIRLENPEHYRELLRRKRDALRKKLRFTQRYALLKGCQFCGYRNCSAALQYHHIDPSQKLFTISQSGGRSMENIKAEIRKCLVLCANCHFELHEQEKHNG
jgi:hypothetical protein